MHLIPDSYGVLREFNQCHSPEDGKFCSGSGATRVGITSYRAGATNRATFDAMRAFEAKLTAIPGVRQVAVQPAQGAYHGGWEPSWSVQYRGNGEARRLLAATGQAHQQDAVLVMQGCRGNLGCNSIGTEFVFDKPVSLARREGLAKLFGAHGLGGWTWYKSGGKTTLRMVAVPHWGGTVAGHTKVMASLRRSFGKLGMGHQTRHTKLHVETLGPGGEIPYEKVTHGARQIAAAV